MTRWLLLLPLLAGVAFSWLRIVTELDDVPRDEEYAAASELLRREGFARERDALVILPPWSLRPLTFVGDLEPISGDAIADRPLHRWARLWAIVEADAERERDALVARRGLPSWARRVDGGRLVVERWDLPAPSVSDDLAARLAADATVRVVDGGAEPQAAVVNRVRRAWLQVSENSDLAVFARPPPDGRLEIEWPTVTVGTSVVVTAGFTRDGANAALAVRSPTGARRTRLRVLVDGELVGTVTREPAFLFATDVIDTARLSGRTASVVFAIDSEVPADFAFDAYVVGEAR